MLSGDDIVAIKAPDYQMVFMYDDNGDPYGFEYITDISSNLYYYMYNAQGDVMGIIDDYGNCVNRYIYDPWGKVVSILDIGLNPAENGSLAHINPIRYRGYFYDAETGFYYLNSRYYDPVVSRFISPDVQINADQGPLGVNLYVYCINNPVNYVDKSGNKASCVLDTISLENCSITSHSYSVITEVGEGSYTIYTKVYVYGQALEFFYNINQKYKIEFYFSENFNFETLIFLNSVFYLAKAIYYTAKKIDERYTLGRSILGIENELFLHYQAYLLGIKEKRANPANIGSTIEKIGTDYNILYDSNASFLNQNQHLI